MTQDRKTAAGSTATMAGTAALSAGASARSHSTHETAASRSVQWDELFLHATPAQRTELLSLARRQGFLYAHQLPVYTNGKKSAPLLEDHGQLNLLANLPSNPPERWHSIEPIDISPVDDALDAAQRQAVARALGTTDVCLIAGLPGTGKSRVIAEIVSQAASRGLRVLFLAPQSQAIDMVLAQVANRDALYAVRCLEPGEKPESLPAAVRGLTHGERARMLRDAVAAAAKARDDAEKTCQRRGQEARLWPELRQLGLAFDDLERRHRELEQQLQALPRQVERAIAETHASGESDGVATFLKAVRDEKLRHQQVVSATEAALQASEEANAEQSRSMDSLQAERDKLLPLVQAKQHSGWWSIRWWRATLAGNVAGRLNDLETKIAAARTELDAAGARSEALRRDRQEQDHQHQASLDRLLRDEVERRRGALQAQLPALAEERRRLEEAWAKLTCGLEPAEILPSSRTAAAVDDAQPRWQAQSTLDEDHCQFARRWSAYLQESADGLASRLPALANLVAGTFAALAADKHFGQTSGLVFDLLILEEAHLLGEADFFRLARRARRWALVGEPTWHCGSAATPSKPAALSFFQRLWAHFHCDPSKLPYAWHSEGERFCCRLRSVPAEQKQRLESERLADFPDIELRILSAPHAPPSLAEVVFPGSLSLAEAKQFIYRELQELAVQTTGRSASLAEQSSHWVFSFAEGAGGPALEIQLDKGLREIVVGDQASSHGVSSWSTGRLEFDKSAGWDRPRVERWLHDHLQLRDLGRTALLEVPHRMRPPLAALLSDMLFGGRHSERLDATAASQAGNGHGHASPMVFIPVPALRRKDKSKDSKDKPADKQSGSLPREGAGLELELGAGRSHERIPGDLKGLVPSRGLINCSEAQALIRRLETLLADADHLKAVCHPHAPGIAVIALYAAQVELIRRLVGRSQRIQHSGVPVEVGLPAAFGQREFPIVVLGLTRSNPRAVSFGDQAAHVVQALTRARSQVILVGDPGTLARRSQWQGRLDHLDESAAHQEEILIKDLVRYLQGKGKHAWAFHLCEGHP